MDWRIVVTILCMYGFVRKFRPLEPFLTPLLRSDSKNFTDVQLYSQIYPVWTYSYLVALVPTFLLADLLRYNIILIVGALFYASTWILLIFGHNAAHMQLMEFCYGFSSATEIAYYAYGYAAIDIIHYKQTTSYMRCVVEFGRFCSYVLGQILISTHSLKYLDLTYLALACSLLLFCIASILPCISWRRGVDRMRQIHEQKFPEPGEDEDAKAGTSGPWNEEVAVYEPPPGPAGILGNEVNSYGEFVKFYFANLWLTFKRIYSTAFMLKWSLWCALAMCGMLQVTTYIQTLWDVMQTSEADVWNAFVEAINTLLAALLAICMQFLTVKWAVWGECTIAIVSIIDCILLIFMSRASSLFLVYVSYIIFRVLYELMFTIALYNIAKHLSTESFGLVFGFNTFIALLLQTVLVFAVDDERGFALDIRQQFLVYGTCYGCIAVFFLVMGAITVVRYIRMPPPSPRPPPPDRASKPESGATYQTSL